MSETQLATTEQQALAPTAGMTLLAGYHLSMADGQTADEYQMDDEELAELDGVKIRPTRLKMNGTNGEFKTTDAPKEQNGVPYITAAILGLLDNSQVLFPKLDDKDVQIWPETGGTWPKFICRADSILGVPRLHQDMTDEQKRIAATLKINGAVNLVRAEEDKHLPEAERRAPLNCTTCPHAQFHDKDKPTCGAARNLLVFDNITKEPALLQVKGTSIKGLDKHLASYKKRKRVLYADVVTIGSKNDSEGLRQWKIMTFTPTAESGVDAAGYFRHIRQTMAPLILEEMRSGRNLIMGSDDELTHDEPAAPAPVGDTLDPIDPLPDGTPSEFDLF